MKADRSDGTNATIKIMIRVTGQRHYRPLLFVCHLGAVFLLRFRSFQSGMVRVMKKAIGFCSHYQAAYTEQQRERERE